MTHEATGGSPAEWHNFYNFLTRGGINNHKETVFALQDQGWGLEEIVYGKYFDGYSLLFPEQVEDVTAKIEFKFQRSGTSSRRFMAVGIRKIPEKDISEATNQANPSMLLMHEGELLVARYSPNSEKLHITTYSRNGIYKSKTEALDENPQ